MAFVATALGAIGGFFGVGGTAAVSTGLAAVGTAISAGAGIAAASGAFKPKAPSLPSLPSTPTQEQAAATAQNQSAAYQAQMQYSGGTTDYTLGSATISPSNITVHTLFGQ